MNSPKQRPPSSPSIVSAIFYPITAVRDWFADTIETDHSEIEKNAASKFISLLTLGPRLLFAFAVFMVQAWSTSREGRAFLLGLPALLTIVGCGAAFWGATFFYNRFTVARTAGYYQFYSGDRASDSASALMFAKKLVEVLPENDFDDTELNDARYQLATAFAQDGELPQAVAIMEELAPLEGAGYTRAHIWLSSHYQKQLSGKVDVIESDRLAFAHLNKIPEDDRFYPSARLALSQLQTRRAAVARENNDQADFIENLLAATEILREFITPAFRTFLVKEQLNLGERLQILLRIQRVPELLRQNALAERAMMENLGATKAVASVRRLPDLAIAQDYRLPFKVESVDGDSALVRFNGQQHTVPSSGDITIKNNDGSVLTVLAEQGLEVGELPIWPEEAKAKYTDDLIGIFTEIVEMSDLDMARVLQAAQAGRSPKETRYRLLVAELQSLLTMNAYDEATTQVNKFFRQLDDSQTRQKLIPLAVQIHLLDAKQNDDLDDPKKFEAFFEANTNCLAVKSNERTAYANLIRILVKMKEDDQFREQFDRLLVSARNPALVHLMIGLSKIREGEISNARNHWTIALQLEPLMSVYLDRLISFATSERDRQIDDILEINSIAVDLLNHPRLFQSLGLNHLRDKSYGEAIEAFQEAVRGNKKLYISVYCLSICYEAAGNPSLASTYRNKYEKIVDSFPPKQQDVIKRQADNISDILSL